MKLSYVTLPMLAAFAAAHELVIPETERYVSSMLSRFHRYKDYAGPTQAHLAPTAVPKNQPAVQTGSADCSFWMEDIAHQGKAAFNTDSTYTVFRNVKDFGAIGDGVTDDTAAINSAISSGNRHGPAGLTTSTNTPAVVYFPAGTYLLSSSLIDFYYTQMIGNPNCMPTLLATPGFVGFGLIDGDEYQPDGNLGFGATNVFWRQIRNLIFDMTAIPGSSQATGIHWPTSQATSLQNLVFKMSDAPGTQHQGVFMEQGSGGFLNDLTFFGGLYGMNQGNQQFTMRNLSFFNSVTAISQIWDWGWTYKGLQIVNCTVGLNMSSGGSTDQGVAAVVVIDSVITNTPVAFLTAYNSTSLPAASGSLVLENVQVNNVASIVKNLDGSVPLAGTTGTKTVGAYAQGHRYTPTGPKNVQGLTTPNKRPASLVRDGSYFQRSKPQYEDIAAASFVSVRTQGAVGDGVNDDTAAVQKAIHIAATAGKVLFFDAGTYRVTKTIGVPAGSRVVGETYSVILSSGDFFDNETSPKPVVRVGLAGKTGVVEWSDMIVSTQGRQSGAILIEWNLASPASNPSGMWDVHLRVGGFIGSNLQGDTCPTTPTKNVKTAKAACVAAYLGMHVTSSASGLYMENNWLWTADHDVDTNAGGNQITVYTARGFLCESTAGNIWMYGTAVEHNTFYQYQFVNTKNIVIGQIQTETAYYEPNPNATVPFKTIAAMHDPIFPTHPYTKGTNGVQVPNAEGWGLRTIDSSVLAYGVGLYSFFNNFSTACSDQGNSSVCQSRILSLESTTSAPIGVFMYDIHTVGTRVVISELDQNNVRTDVADWSDNQSGFSEEVNLFRPV